MDHSSLIEKLYKNTDQGIKLGLINVKKLDGRLAFPSKKFKSIHVAGTNGKGSVTVKIAEALLLSGYMVGVFTSPHISNFRERILINGEMAAQELIDSSLTHIFDLASIHNIDATFFEINTLLAFDLFAKAKVDFAVIETGLGGRLDATNIIKPLVSIITSISFDHMHILGDTLEKIAYEKAGIIKKRVPVFVGPCADHKVIRDKAKLFKCFYRVSKKVPGWYDSENSELAKEVLHFLQKRISITELSIDEGIKKRPPCRLEIHTREDGTISKKFTMMPQAVIFDVAHNESGLLNLFKALKYKFPGFSVRAIIAMSKDKDLNGCSRIISSNCSFIHLIDTSHERLISKEKFSSYFPREKISFQDDLAVAVKKAMDLACQNNEILLICGSFFIMKDVRLVLLEP